MECIKLTILLSLSFQGASAQLFYADTISENMLMRDQYTIECISELVLTVWSRIDLLRAISISYQDRADYCEHFVDVFLQLYGSVALFYTSHSDFSPYVQQLEHIECMLDSIKEAFGGLFCDMVIDESRCMWIVIKKVDALIGSMLHQ
ncbi:MAG: hypothetical protein WC707_01875 [Candidatus Babeliaceae bacterium]|jgi:hypothetical protein